MDAQRQRLTEETGAGRPQRDAQSLLIIAYLSGQPTREAFVAAWLRLLDIYAAAGIDAGWSPEVAQEFADEDMARASAVLDSLNPHFVNEPGHA